jgi:TRAP-type C4-dicarboxylate transport system permease small subunit
MMIWLTFLGAGPALAQRQPHRGGKPAGRPARAAGPDAAGRDRDVIAATLIIMAWLGWEYADFAWEQESPVLNWSLGKIYLALPIGSVLTLLHLFFVAPKLDPRRRMGQAGGLQTRRPFDTGART